MEKDSKKSEVETEMRSKSFASLPPPGISMSDSSFEEMETGITIVWGAVPVGHDKHQNVQKPQQIQVPGGISMLALSSHYTAAINNNGTLYTWGHGMDGALGHSGTVSETSPRAVQSLLKQRVVKIALGDVHAAAVTDQGALFTWGENAYGRLGLGDTKRRYGPELVRSMAVQRVTDVSLGTKHSACLTEKGHLYTWGGGSYGRLGHGSSEQEHTPRRVEFEDDLICDLDVATKCCCAVSVSGRLYMWGRCEFQFKGRDVHIPTSVMNDGVKLARISDSHALILLRNGDVMSYGDGSMGVLGHKKKELYGTPTVIETLKSRTVVDLKAYRHASFAILDSGDVYAWGLDKIGGFGLGTDAMFRKPIFHPCHLNVGKLHGRQISCVAAHDRVFGLVVKALSNGTVPSFTKRLPSMIKKGLMGSLTFEIVITGIPIPKKILWEKNGLPFEDFDDYDMIQIHEQENEDDDELDEIEEKNNHFAPKLKITARIQCLERLHTGKWTCIAVNSQGRTSMSCDVQVMELAEWEARVHQDVLNSQELVKSCMKNLQEASRPESLTPMRERLEGESTFKQAETMLAECESVAKLAEEEYLESLRGARHWHERERSLYEAVSTNKKALLIDAIERHAEAWKFVVEKEKIKNRASENLSRAKLRVDALRSKVDALCERAKIPEERIHRNRVALTNARELAKKSIAELRRVRDLEAKMRKEISSAVRTRSCGSVFKILQKEGYSNYPPVASIGLDFLLRTAAHSRKGLENVRRCVNFEEIDEIAKTLPKKRDQMDESNLSSAHEFARTLSEILQTADFVDVGEIEKRPSDIVDALEKFAIVQSVYENAVIALSREKVYRTAAMNMSLHAVHRVLSVLGFANSFNLSRPAREHTNRAFETYTMLEWVKSNDLDDILQNILEEDLVKLSYVKEYLSIETLQDWGISGKRALRVMELLDNVDEESEVAITNLNAFERVVHSATKKFTPSKVREVMSRAVDSSNEEEKAKVVVSSMLLHSS